MSANERTSREVAALAARVLRTGEATEEEIKILAASALTQAADREAEESVDEAS